MFVPLEANLFITGHTNMVYKTGIRSSLLPQTKMGSMDVPSTLSVGILVTLIVSQMQSLDGHFRQSVLANMRGTGESVFETDFPPGTDQVSTMFSEPYGKERFELEMGKRLRYMTKEDRSKKLD